MRQGALTPRHGRWALALLAFGAAVACGARTALLDADAVARAVRLVRSTSPSSLLLASLDSARRQLYAHGEALLDRTIAASMRAREAIGVIPGIELVGPELVGRPGIAGWDPLRIVIDVRGTGRTGYDLAAELRARYDIYIELATHATMVLVLGLGQPVEPLQRFAHDFAETVRILARPGEGRAIATPVAPAEHQTVVPIRDAFLGREDLDLADLAAQRRLGLLAREAVARPHLPDGAELALDLSVADPPLAVPRAAFLDDRAGPVGALLRALARHVPGLVPCPP